MTSLLRFFLTQKSNELVYPIRSSQCPVSRVTGQLVSGMGDGINPIENTGKPRLLGSSAKCTTWPCDIEGQGPPLRTRFQTLLRFQFQAERIACPD